VRYGSESFHLKFSRSCFYSKTGSVCGRRVSAMSWWNSAVPCIISGCAWPLGSRWF